MSSRTWKTNWKETTPHREACFQILAEHGVPGHIRRHSEEVARLACRLATDLLTAQASPLDTALLEAAALLHDIAKIPCLGTSQDHAAEGARLLRALGLKRVAVLVERHIDLGSWKESGAVTEAEILNYSDKRVLHEKVVSLEERFADLTVRYGREDPGLREVIAKNRLNLEALERKIFRCLPYSSGDIA